MNKEFVPYEQALTLKELGFDASIFGYYYTLNGKDWKFADDKQYDALDEFYNIGSKFTISAPLKQQAFRWFRDKYGLDGVSFYNYTGYMWNIIDFKNSNATKNVTVQEDDMQQYSSKEEAEQACLIKLIEIVKNK